MAMDFSCQAEDPEPGPQASLLAAQLKRMPQQEDTSDLGLLQASRDPLSLRRYLQADQPSKTPANLNSGGNQPFWLAAISSGEKKLGPGLPPRKARALRVMPPSAPARSQHRGDVLPESFEPDASDRLLAIDLKVIRKLPAVWWGILIVVLAATALYLWLQC